MKPISSHRPKWYFLGGAIGLAGCVLIFLYAEYVLTAPNQATLSNYRTLITGVLAILFVLSVTALGRGVQLVLQRRRLERTG